VLEREEKTDIVGVVRRWDDVWFRRTVPSIFLGRL